ncbi:MAG: ankyrin repeat domain-containing protein [Alphaproteobacteria bacterium]|nr:ankyrin repeat domain-containing protein [Alphaproteobacteria bacterium]
MKKPILLVGSAVITMSSFCMSNNYSDSYGTDCSSSNMQEITNHAETSVFHKRSGAELNSPGPDKRIRTSTKQIPSEVTNKIDNFIKTRGKIYNSHGKQIIKRVLIACLTEPNKTIREIAEEFETDQLSVKVWLKRANLSLKRKELTYSYRESKLSLAQAVLEYPEKGVNKAAKDNGINKSDLVLAINKLADQNEIKLKKDQTDKTDHKKKQALLQAYYENQDLDDLYKIYNGNEKRTKRILGELVYATLTSEEEKQWMTYYSGLLQDCRQGLLTTEGRIYKHAVSKCKDYLVRYVARRLAKEIKENPTIEESTWWNDEFDPSPEEGDWWNNKNELRYEYEREIPKEIREKMINTYNRGELTRKGIAKLYKTKKEIVTNVLAHKTTTGHQINKRQGGGNLKEVVTDLLTKSQEEVKTKYKYSDRTIRDLLLVIDHWKKLSNDQKNVFKKAIKTKNLPDLSEIKESKVKRNRYINDNFKKYLFTLISTNDEIMKTYNKDQKRTRELQQKANIWKIIAKKEMSLIKATKIGNMNEVKNLIEENTDINCKDEYGQTPLMWAAAIENKNIVRYLLNHHADVNHEDGNGDTALTIAKSFGHDEIVNLLKQAGTK